MLNRFIGVSRMKRPPTPRQQCIQIWWNWNPIGEKTKRIICLIACFCHQFYKQIIVPPFLASTSGQTAKPAKVRACSENTCHNVFLRLLFVADGDDNLSVVADNTWRRRHCQRQTTRITTTKTTTEKPLSRSTFGLCAVRTEARESIR